MTRILHIIDERDAPGGLAGTLALVADAQKAEEGEHRTLLLGGQAIRDAATRVGLTCHKLLPSPKGLARAVLAIRRGPRDLLAQADRVDCWSVHAAVFTAELGCETMNPRFNQVGDTPFAVQTLDPSRINRALRQTLRDRWGLDENDRIVALLSDHPKDYSCLTPALIAALAQETCRRRSKLPIRVRLLLHPNHRQLAQARTVQNLAGYSDLLVQDAAIACPWEALPACDAAMAIDPASAGNALLWARACRLGVAGPTVPDSGPHDARPKNLARQLTDLLFPSTATR